jgi:hypothetical protein
VISVLERLIAKKQFMFVFVAKVSACSFVKFFHLFETEIDLLLHRFRCASTTFSLINKAIGIQIQRSISVSERGDYQN